MDWIERPTTPFDARSTPGRAAAACYWHRMRGHFPVQAKAEPASRIACQGFAGFDFPAKLRDGGRRQLGQFAHV